jgi:radical SAM protein with 4Fe4S-binding SPASM domain
VPPAYQRKYRKSELNSGEVFKVIDQLKDCGCLYLGFTGGEPFFRPDILAILDYAKKQGFQIIIYSNGSQFNKKIVSQLAQINPNKIDITLPGMSEHVFEKITGKRGSWKAVFKGIDLLRDKNIPLGFKTCFLQGNAGEIDKIKSFCRSLHSPHRLDTLLSARLDGSPEPYKFRGRLFESPSVKKHSKITLPKQTCATKCADISSFFSCGAGISQAAITPAGELKLCAMIDQPKYNILDIGFRKAWDNLQGFVRETGPDKTYKCLSCDLKSYCVWCPARSWLYNKSFCACDPGLREWAQGIKEGYER